MSHIGDENIVTSRKMTIVIVNRHREPPWMAARFSKIYAQTSQDFFQGGFRPPLAVPSLRQSGSARLDRFEIYKQRSRVS
jgi:hypothetical protein